MIEKPDLPYALDALEPHISKTTLEFHYGKHHQAYVTNLNKLIEGTELENASLEEIIKATAGNSEKAGVFNNAAQVWNHTFYWQSISPNGGNLTDSKLSGLIESSFGSLDNFKSEFAAAGATQFGSGWAWLAQDGDKLVITKTANAETPITSELNPLLTMDVWEHAYYLDYQNKRPDYISTFIEKLINWDNAASLLK
jgi:superoxide dismutase, Fe-Mn family